MSDTTAGLLQAGALIAALALAYRPLGGYMARVFTSERDLRVERVVYRLVGVDPKADQRWPVYAASVLAFSLVSVVGLYALQRVQDDLPLSLGFPGVDPALAFNTAASFVTNTNWQSYSGEATMGHLAQMAGPRRAELRLRGGRHRRRGRADPRVHPLADRPDRQLLGRPGARRRPHPAADLGVGAIALIALGAIQNLSSGTDVTTLVGGHQTITGGPVASQEAIKELGTNGGGFYNANSVAPVREPQRAQQPARDLPAAADPGRADPHVRPDGRRQAPGLRDPRRDGRDLGHSWSPP